MSENSEGGIADVTVMRATQCDFSFALALNGIASGTCTEPTRQLLVQIDDVRYLSCQACATQHAVNLKTWS